MSVLSVLSVLICAEDISSTDNTYAMRINRKALQRMPMITHMLCVSTSMSFKGCRTRNLIHVRVSMRVSISHKLTDTYICAAAMIQGAPVRMPARWKHKPMRADHGPCTQRDCQELFAPHCTELHSRREADQLITNHMGCIPQGIPVLPEFRGFRGFEVSMQLALAIR